MEILTPPIKSKQEQDQWYGNKNAGGPSQPRIVEANEYAEKPMFVHPAEKPQGNSPVYRPQLYESF
jgi:hypothetical protein